MIELTDGWVGEVAFLAGLLVLTALTLGLQRWARVRLGWTPVTAILRATLQLAVVAALLSGVLATGWTVALFVLLMLTTASLTSGGRISELYRGRQAAVVAVVVGALVTIVLVFGLHLMDWTVRYLVAVAGIVIGNAMSATTLAGRQFRTLAGERSDEIQGWLALGATPRQAHDDIGRHAVHEMLIPNLDQTRSTGLVTLPGAFVGAIMGGASPLEAAKFQLVVLAGIALTMTIAGIIVSRFASGSPTVPGARA
ncbi:ABC transporter permease [Janibacter sp. YIM B02568]|uniref:ABC transporter permease n=1 Tax=Janibacter endophyticus TaxID=2806261 RepID=UPI001951DF3C|nr:ABC transporter permease [Janibacter endophyticus]MBM6546031.1 ABC transporter permease [Janibacter endophyticus]